MAIKILVVDNEIETCRALKRYLENESGYNVEFETDPADALERIKHERFQIVLTEMMMQGIDGIELLRKIKKVDELVQVIMMTTSPTVDRVIACLETGVSDYIMKPFGDLAEVKEIVDQVASKLKRWREIVLASQKLNATTG